MRGLVIRLLVPAVVLVALTAQQPPDRPELPGMPPCAADDPCPDPSKPWMRGTTEIQCAMPDKIDAARAASPSRNIVPCGVCQHKCNPFDPNAEQTDNRSWDPACSARCSPRGCACKNPCDS